MKNINPKIKFVGKYNCPICEDSFPEKNDIFKHMVDDHWEFTNRLVKMSRAVNIDNMGTFISNLTFYHSAKEENYWHNS